MKNTFNKDLKQRLDNASLQEAGLRFDKDKLWGKIEKKKAKKRIAFLPWISHTAAVAAGLAAGIFLFVHKDQLPSSDHQAVVQQKKIPVVQTVVDTVYIVKNETPHQKPASITITKTPQPAPVVTAQKTLPDETNNVPTVKEEQPVLVMNKYVPAKVLHLADIDNENSKPRMREQEKPSFFVAFPDRNQSGSDAETFSMLIAQKLNSKKN